MNPKITRTSPGEEHAHEGLSDIYKIEAEKLNAIFKRRKQEFNFSQQSFATDNGLSSQQVVWQYLNAVIPLNLQAAVRFARGLFCAVSDFSPRIAQEIESLGLAVRPSATRPEGGQLTPKEDRIIEFYRTLGREGRELLSCWADSYLTSKQKKEPPSETHPFFSTLLNSPLVAPESVEAPESNKAPSTNKAAKVETKAARNSGALKNVESSRTKRRK